MNKITVDTAALKALSISSQKRLAKKARLFANAKPGMRTANGFWQSLSAQMVMEVAK